MYLKDLKPTTEVIIDVVRGEEMISLASKVQDILDNGVVVYVPSTYNGDLFTFEKGDILFLRAVVKPSILQWSCDEWEIKKQGGLSLLYLISHSKGKSCNRREAYRVSMGIRTKSKLNEDDVFDVDLIDMSTLGVGFETYKDLNVGDILMFALSDDNQVLSLAVKIVRKKPVQDGSRKYHYGAIIIDNVNGDKLEKFVWKQQLEEIRRLKKVRKK